MTGAEALLPGPREVVPAPHRTLSEAPNRVEGMCSDRLRRAVARLPDMGIVLSFRVDASPTPVPALADDYAYRLVTGDTVRVEANSEWGALTALATLVQLGAGGELAVGEIRDAPCYPWRGLMIDTVRHFITLDTLRRTVDAMAFYKLNVLHLHLTDDQGFRFQSKAYPELASKDAYSVDEMRSLVAYAADRAVRVVPELDVPGHVTSWLAAHPEWGASDTAPDTAPSTRFGVHDACLDVHDPSVLRAVDTLLEEFADVFPDEFLHFGGDEVGRDCAAFHRHVVDRIEALGRRAMGWDECLHPELPTGTTVQAWRGIAGRDAAVDAGHDCVVSAPYYLDLFYPADVHCAFDPATASPDTERAMLAHPRLAHVRHGLQWMPEFAEYPRLPSRPSGRILGGEACLWSELVADGLLDTRVWSRMPAIAERFWNGAQAKTADVYERMAATRRTLARLGVVPDHERVTGDHPELATLIEMLEPVKWYVRLLGPAEFRRRVNGLGGEAEPRPYDTTTPLDRIVDRIPPESLASRRAEADLAAGAPMSTWIDGWRRQQLALAQHPQLHEELRDASDALARIADIVAGDSDTDASALAGPFGEYVLPIAHVVAEWQSKAAPGDSNRARAALRSWPEVTGGLEVIDAGHINDTYLVGGHHVLQRLNREVFRDPEALMRNLAKALRHEGGKLLSSPLATPGGEPYAIDPDGDIWRVFAHIPSRSFENLPDQLLAPAGEAFGGLLATFADFGEALEPVIDGFHDLAHYLAALDAVSVDGGPLVREIDDLRERFRPGEPQRVIHGDCKVNNLLFHPTRDVVVAVIDLDTLMLGDPAWDFGDLVRSAFAGTEETHAATPFSASRFEPLCRGFFSAFGVVDDIARYAAAPAYMSFMLAVRFLTDHLQGDAYFKVERRGDNLLRARSQLELAHRFLAAEDDMALVIGSVCAAD